MKKLFFFFVLVFLISFSSSQSRAAVSISSCTYTNAPGSGALLFRASGPTNAHVEDPSFSNYPYFVRCSGTDLGAGAIFSASPPSYGGNTAYVYSNTNSHVATQPITFLSGGVAYLYDTSGANAQLSCGTVTGISGGDGNAECTATGWDACVYSVSGVTNAHVAACSGVGISYPNKICCRVGPPPSGLQYIKINPSNPSRNIGVTVFYGTTAFYSNGSEFSVTTAATYTSSNPAVVSCAAPPVQNRCTANSLGTAIITANYSGKSDYSTFNVVNSPSGTPSEVLITPGIATINIGNTQSYTLSLITVDGAVTDVTSNAATSYLSSISSVASMSGNVATGVAVGESNITGSYSGLSDTSYLNVNPAGTSCEILSTRFTWTDPAGTIFDLSGTEQSDGTPVNMTVETNGCSGRRVYYKLHQKNCTSTSGNDQLINTYPNWSVVLDKADREIVLDFDPTRGTLGCPNNLAQYYFETYNIVPSNNIIGDKEINSSIIYVNQTVYTSPDNPCTGCYPGGSSCPSPRSCWGIPNGYSCISESGLCFAPAGSKCCLGIESGTIGDIKVIITREGTCQDIGRNDGTGQVKELWRRINTTNNFILESHESFRDCLLAKPANIPFFSFINFVIVISLISLYYVFTLKRKVKYK